MSEQAKEQTSMFDGINNLFTALTVNLIGTAICMMIEACLKDDGVDEIGNNYLVRFGTKGRQEKIRKINHYKTLNRKIKSYNQLRHYKRFNVVWGVSRVN